MTLFAICGVYFLHRKNETLGAFKKFCALVEKGTNRCVKTFRTDRGGEFLSNDLGNSVKARKLKGTIRHPTHHSKTVW